MAKTSGTQVNIGLGIEVTAGTAVAAAIYPKWLDFSMNPIVEKSLLTAARGVRNESSDSMIKRKYGQGSLSVVPNVEIAPYLLRLALGGTVATALLETGVYQHTISEQNSNASHKSFTLLSEEGAIITEKYANCIINTLAIEVSDDYAKMTADIIGKYPDTGTVTEAYTEETEFAYHQTTIKFGTSVTNAASQSATPVKSISLNINNNVMLDEAFMSGSNEALAGSIIPGRQKVSGSYVLHFEDTTELDKYKANTKNAAVIQMTGALIGATKYEEITINLARLVLTKPPKEFSIDGLLILTQDFEVEYNATETYAIQSLVTNEEANAGDATYTPA